MNSDLERVEIYFWDCMGEPTVKTCEFRMEIVERGQIRYVVGTSGTLSKKLKYLQAVNGVQLPKVSWKVIVGDNNGGDSYKWESPDRIKKNAKKASKKK